MKVAEAMHRGVEWVAPNATLTEIARLMKKYDIGAIPVGHNDRLVGMVTDRDIVCRALAEGGDPAKLTAADVMTKGIVYCQEDAELDEAVQTMENKRIRRLPVISARKRMVGMLSLGDVSHSTSEETSGEVLRAVATPHRH